MRKLLILTLALNFKYCLLICAEDVLCISSLPDSIVALTDSAFIHIDQAPFSSPYEIISKDFRAYSELRDREPMYAQKNSIGWIKISFCPDGDEFHRGGYLSFGRYARLIVYQLQSDSLVLMTRMGDLYKNEIFHKSPDRWLYPYNMGSGGDTTTLYVYAADSYPNKFDIEKLKISFIPKGQENQFLDYSKFRLLGGFIHVGLIFLIGFLICICILFITLYKDYRLLGFALICFAALLYYLRDMEVYFEQTIFWSRWDEGPLRVETILRGFIAASFIIFVMTNFSFGKWFKTIRLTSIIAVSLSLLTGIWALCNIGPYHISTPVESILFSLDIVVTLVNSLFILGLLWTCNQPFARNFVIGIMTFIAFSYCGLLLNTTRIGELDSLLSSKMYSTYGMIIFLFYIAQFAFRRSYQTQKEMIIQTVRNEQLQELSRTKTRLYNNITHEFRTPLTVINGMLDTVKGYQREKNIIKRNSQQLLDLVNKMLLLSKADAGSLTLNMKQGDIIHYLDYITESFLSLAEKKNIRLLLYSEEKEIIMDYDEDKIKTISTNLLSNAIKFTPVGGKVIIILSKSGNQLIWKVKDSGIGIDEADIENIFEIFYQSGNLKDNNWEGSGIGLSLVKELVKLCNGSIDVESHIGKGTTFEIILPITNGATFEISDSTIRTSGNKGKLFKSPVPKQIIGQEDKVILVVEDNEDVRDYICRCLPPEYLVVEAENGEEGIIKATEILPDIIISDVMMPEKDGYQLTQQLKSDERTNHIPIILLTAKATQDEKVEGLKYGADSYIIKPFDKTELLVRIEKLISLREQLQVKYRSDSPSERKELPDWLIKFETILATHLSEEISVVWISKQMFMSRTQLHRKISSLTGLSASQYIKGYKLGQAKKMVLSTDESIGMIASKIGYKNSGHFATDFKNQFGEPPSKYRQKK